MGKRTPGRSDLGAAIHPEARSGSMGGPAVRLITSRRRQDQEETAAALRSMERMTHGRWPYSCCADGARRTAPLFLPCMEETDGRQPPHARRHLHGEEIEGRHTLLQSTTVFVDAAETYLQDGRLSTTEAAAAIAPGAKSTSLLAGFCFSRIDRIKAAAMPPSSKLHGQAHVRAAGGRRHLYTPPVVEAVAVIGVVRVKSRLQDDAAPAVEGATSKRTQI